MWNLTRVFICYCRFDPGSIPDRFNSSGLCKSPCHEPLGFPETFLQTCLFGMKMSIQADNPDWHRNTLPVSSMCRTEPPYFRIHISWSWIWLRLQPQPHHFGFFFCLLATVSAVLKIQKKELFFTSHNHLHHPRKVLPYYAAENCKVNNIPFNVLLVPPTG